MLMEAMAGAGAAGSLAGTYANWKMGLKNLNMQKENLKYQKDLQQDIFEREDNATQRRVADLKAAGLSPVLAAGSAAGSGAVISTKAPEQAPIGNVAAEIMQLIKMASDIASSSTQRDLTTQDLYKSKAQTDLAQKQVENVSAEIANKNINTAIKAHDYDIYKLTNTTSTAGGLTGSLRNLFGFTDSPAVKQLKKEINDKVDNNIRPADMNQKTRDYIDYLKKADPWLYQKYMDSLKKGGSK